MIEVVCLCGVTDRVPEYDAVRPWLCAGCGRRGMLVCAEKLPEDAGAGDFDIRLHVTKGPARIGEFFQLGGIAEIEIGSSPQEQISLPGHGVSTHHCRLKRVDFGPSRWELTDLNTPGGTFINSQRITAQEIQPGDVIQIGDFTIQCDLAQPGAKAVPTAAIATAHAHAPKAAKAATDGTAKKPVGKAQAGHGAIGYAHPQQEVEAGRPLGDCDIAWVMSIRNGARVASYAVTPVAFSYLFFCGVIGAICMPFTALAMGVSGWFLSAREPGVKENGFWAAIRMLLKITGTATGIAIPLFVLGVWMDSEAVTDTAGYCMLAVPAYMFLYLLYLCKLASRLPNSSMVASCILLMLALPASVGMVVFAAMGGGSGASAAVTAGIGALIMKVALIAYVALLFWFDRSFS